MSNYIKNNHSKLKHISISQIINNMSKKITTTINKFIYLELFYFLFLFFGVNYT